MIGRGGFGKVRILNLHSSEIKIMNLTLGMESGVQEDNADICHEGNVESKDYSKEISDISNE